MSQNKKWNRTIKWIIAVLISLQIGSFVTETLYTTNINVWICRMSGAMITAMMGMIFYDVWINKRNHHVDSKQSS